MSIYKAMWTGVSGLAAEGQTLGVIGDNIANSNTVGFKMSRALFEDVLGGAVGQNVGGGVRMARSQQIFAQGSVVNTGQQTDLALTGDGFFVVKGALGGMSGQFYSRAGQFTINNEGSLVNPQGLTLQGYVANPDGTFQASLSDVQVPTTPLSPKPTSTIEIDANLDANDALPSVTPFDPLDPTNSSNFSTSTTVYDSLGNAHSVDIYFEKTAAGWSYHALVDGGELAGGTAGTSTEIASGTLTFDGSGNLVSHTPSPVPGPVDFLGANPGQALTFDLGTPGTNDGITQLGMDSSITAQTQDGYGAGSLSGITVDANGVVMGSYDNGEQLAIAQLAIAKFSSNDGLGRAGGNCWIQTRASGEPVMGAAGSGGRAAVVAGALEQSNVDIAQQFVEMIAHQRAFQANSKTITTADDMLQEIVNLKR